MSKEKSWVASNITDLPPIADALLESVDSRILALDGPMGSGKTTLIKELCRALDSEDDVHSPTFSLVNEYRSGEGEPIFHFDLYRLEDPKEALDIGCLEYFDSGHYCFIEWPDKIKHLLPENVQYVELKAEGETRTFSLCP
jgi:tRNA threonylcarbamoyladenosine biosynthesis protein TsaE